MARPPTGWTPNGCGWNAWCAPEPCTRQALSTAGWPAWTSTRCSTGSATTGCWRSWTSTANCTCWSAARAGCACCAPDRSRRRATPSSPPASPCAAWRTGGSPAMIVPPGRLHGVPWALLPALAGRAHAVAPSASAWLTSRTAARPTRSDVVLIRGPGLATFGAEVAALTGLYPGARLLRDESATATRVLDELDGASLAHIAAHGTFRADNPLFSSMRLADGALTVYDLERLRRAPYRIVLPSCDSGRLQPVGADELLGLTTALLPLGTAGIVASLVPVDDQATATLMLALHKALGGTTSLADALHTARQAMPD